MPDRDWDPDAWIDAMAPVMGIVISDEQRPGVRTFLEIAAGMAAKLEDADLPDDELAPAAVFAPEAEG